jgi:hypothetical protein
MMHKLLLTTHWTTDEAEIILSFIDELREVVLAGYEAEVQTDHHLKNEATEEQGETKNSSNRIPF